MGLPGHLTLPATSVQQVSVTHRVISESFPHLQNPLHPKVYAVLCLPFAKEYLQFRSLLLVTFLKSYKNRHPLEFIVWKW